MPRVALTGASSMAVVVDAKNLSALEALQVVPPSASSTVEVRGVQLKDATGWPNREESVAGTVGAVAARTPTPRTTSRAKSMHRLVGNAWAMAVVGAA